MPSSSPAALASRTIPRLVPANGLALRRRPGPHPSPPPLIKTLRADCCRTPGLFRTRRVFHLFFTPLACYAPSHRSRGSPVRGKCGSFEKGDLLYPVLKQACRPTGRAGDSSRGTHAARRSWSRHSPVQIPRSFRQIPPFSTTDSIIRGSVRFSPQLVVFFTRRMPLKCLWRLCFYYCGTQRERPPPPCPRASSSERQLG